MNSLVVAPFLPYPLVFGGAIRLYHTIRMLSTFSDVSLLCYRSWDGEDPTDHLQTLCHRVLISDSRPPSSTLRRARSLVSRHSYQLLAHRSAELQRSLDRLVADESFDVVLVEMTPMGALRLPEGPLRVLDLQNIEHELVERRADVAESTTRRMTLRLEAKKVKNEEIAVCSTFDLVLAPSDRETEIIRSWGVHQAETMANTIDATSFAPPTATPNGGTRLAFVGTTHVDANRDGVRYFVRDVYPQIRQQVPDVELDIVGGDPPPDVRALADVPGVTVTGYVPDVRDYMARATALVVPLRSGGGTRLKILEGLSFGVPTISTTIGAEGLDLVNGEHILLADDAASFAAATVAVLSDAELRSRLSSAGRQLVEHRYDWRSQAERLHSLVASALVQRASPHR
jgi:glycosyltransferase involved in cell wall biosynthesis